MRPMLMLSALLAQLIAIYEGIDGGSADDYGEDSLDGGYPDSVGSDSIDGGTPYS